jgi:hypothetical protein
MKTKLILTALCFISFSVFAQMNILGRFQGSPPIVNDYYFVAEKPEADDSTLPVISALLAALVSDADTLSFISYSEKPLLVCPPLGGNTPDLTQLITDKLKAAPAARAAAENALAAAISLADEQAAVNARPEALRRLFIFGNSKTKATGMSPPKNFSGGIFYISLDAPPEQAIAGIAGSGHFWHFGIKQPPAGEAAVPEDPVNFADGFAALISAVNDRYTIGQKNDQTFTAGSFFKMVKNVLVLVENVQTGPALSVSKDNKAVPEARLVQAGQYGIIKLNNAPAGTYTVAGGSIIQVAEWAELSPLIFTAGGLVLAAALLILFILIITAAKRRKEQRMPIFKVVCEVNSKNAGFPEPEICTKKNPKNPLQFESGAHIKEIVMIGMRGEIEESKLSPIVKDDSPFIQFDKQRKQWLLKYGVQKPVEEEAQDAPEEDEGPDLFGRNKTPSETDTANTAAGEFDVDEEYVIPAHNSKFEVPCFFIDRNYRLFLIRQ